MALQSVRRPSKTADPNEPYRCPAEAPITCNDIFLHSAELAEYAICIPDTVDRQEACPITSFAFTLDHMDFAEAGMYQ